MKAACLAAFVVVVAGCASPLVISYPNEVFGVEQLYARRADLDGKMVHAKFVWRYNFECSDTYFFAPDGTARILAVKFDSNKLRSSSPNQWAIVQGENRKYWNGATHARNSSETPGDLRMEMDADVEVTVPKPLNDGTNVIGIPDVMLNVIVIHSVREEGAH